MVIAGLYHRSSVWTLHGSIVVTAALYHRSSVWTLHGSIVVTVALYYSVVYGHSMGIVW